MALFNATKFEIKKNGTVTSVPNADIAKIMYYINCVCTVIEYKDNDIDRYRNYNNWRNMSDEEDRLIFLLGLMLSPKELEGKVFFQAPNLCPDSSNEFYEIGQIKNQIFVASSVLIGGQTRQVKKIMTYKPIWMQNNYFEPMGRLMFRFSPEGQRQEQMMRSAGCTIS